MAATVDLIAGRIALLTALPIATVGQLLIAVALQALIVLAGQIVIMKRNIIITSMAINITIM